jgi:hypothetical protein
MYWPQLKCHCVHIINFSCHFCLKLFNTHITRGARELRTLPIGSANKSLPRIGHENFKRICLHNIEWIGYTFENDDGLIRVIPIRRTRITYNIRVSCPIDLPG